MIESLAFVAYPVTDIVRARQFYEETLGLRLTRHFQDEWLEYDLGDSTFAITTADEEHRPGAHGGAVAFEVGDFDAFIVRLKSLEVRFVKEVFHTPVCRFAVVADPDGNEVIIHQRAR